MAIEQLVDILKGLPEGIAEDTKKAIKDLFQDVTKEAGKAKTDLEQYKTGATEYKKLYKKFQDNGLKPEQIDEVLADMGVKKSLSDELEVMKRIATEKEKEAKDYQKQLNAFKVETTMSEKVKAAMNEFKDSEGKPQKVLEKFINKKELFKDIDLESPVLVQDRISKVLTAAYQEQVAFMKDLGVEFGAKTTHTVPVGDGQFGSGKALDLGQLKKTMNEGGNNIDAAARALQLAMNAARP
jgi:vacuolar-type H+-ATPase subunit I/STV1